MIQSNGKPVFEYDDYRKYLQLKLAPQGETRGLRTQLAIRSRTKPAFITRMIQGKINLSPEHIEAVNDLFGHTPDEAHFFTLLVLYARAGTARLEKYYLDQIQEIRQKRANYLERIKATETLSTSHQSIYYSQWYYGAIHLLTSIPGFQIKEKIAERLKLPLSLVSQALEVLVQQGLVQLKAGKYVMSNKRIYLKKDSPWISQMHMHYRNRAIHSFTSPEKDDFHFSQAMSLSLADYAELRNGILELLAKFEPKIAASKEEEAFVLGLDLFRMV